MSVKAIVLYGPGRLELQEFPDPQLNEGMAVVRTSVAGICGTDRHIYDGHLRFDHPVILGHENVGIVEEVAGSFKTVENEPLSVGDRVLWNAGFETCGECFYCKWLPSNYGTTLCEKSRAYGFENCEEYPYLLGGWAEKVVILPGTAVYKVPDNLSDIHAVLVDPLASTSGIERAVFHCSWLGMGLGLGQTVVVQGSGTIGILAAVKAQLLGATRVIMIGGPKERLSMATEFGVDRTIDIEETKNPDDRVGIIRDLTEGVGADVVVDCAGVPLAVPEGLDMLRRGGIYVELGNFTDTGTVTINPFKHLCHKEVVLIGQWAYGSTQFRKDIALLLKHRDAFPFEKIVTHQFALHDYAEAIEAVSRQECVKVVFAP
jgi:L-iditol 2-dehydrogenase